MKFLELIWIINQVSYANIKVIEISSVSREECKEVVGVTEYKEYAYSFCVTSML